jgi:hypothetical protein
MELRFTTLEAVSFYFCKTLNQCRNLACVTFVCKHFSSYQGYRNYRWDLIRYAKFYLTKFILYWNMTPCIFVLKSEENTLSLSFFYHVAGGIIFRSQ